MLSLMRGRVVALPTRICPSLLGPVAIRRFCTMKASSESSTEAKQAPQEQQDDPSGMKVLKIEEAGEEAWSGVVQKEGTEGRVPPWVTTSVLVTGDTFVYILFATIGRMSHDEGLSISATLGTAAPFLLGWYVSAALLGGYGEGAKSGRIAPAAATAFRCWLLATPLGLGLRSLAVGHAPPLPFVAVAGGFSLALMMGWRIGYAALTPSSKDFETAKGDRKGNPFEFLKFLDSIIRRW